MENYEGPRTGKPNANDCHCKKLELAGRFGSMNHQPRCQAKHGDEKPKSRPKQNYPCAPLFLFPGFKTLLDAWF
jgi:hypothetical protein